MRLSRKIVKQKNIYSDMRPSMVTHGDFEYALHLTHPKCTHTVVNTHTPWIHTQSSEQPFMLQHPGSSWGFGAFLKGTSLWYWGWRESCTFTPPTYNSCRAGTHTQLATYSLTIRPWLPLSSVAQIGQFCHCLLILVLLKTCRTYAMNIKGALLNNIVLYHVIMMNE